MADPGGGGGGWGQWVRSNPNPRPQFLIIQFGLTETKLFHFHGIFKKNEIKSEKRTPPIHI